MDIVKLKTHVEMAEGRRAFPYEDSVKKVTIGVGRNLDDRGLSEDEIDYLLNNDLDIAIEEAKSFDWFDGLNDDRKLVIVDMIFNLGLPRFKGFINTISAIKAGNFELAAGEMMDSKWARQVGVRAQILARTMAKGEYPEIKNGSDS